MKDEDELKIAREGDAVVNNFIKLKTAEGNSKTKLIASIAGAAALLITSVGIFYTIASGKDLSSLGGIGDILKGIISVVTTVNGL